ncbi:unnamed protein product [Prorocentrum cordatum]|uniref:Translin n=1 Tax=Prorocentrum cordatum TaxID=2364126 RepID=A0ABN9TQP6_9DINO|nr:unnamed protein product [Polarella glacialis]
MFMSLFFPLSMPPNRASDSGCTQLSASSDRALVRARSSSPGRRGSTSTAERDDQLPGELASVLKHVKEQFDRGRFSNSGLAGPFRDSSQGHFRSVYLSAIQASDELMYLLGVVLVQFQRISEGLGDYGMIRVAPWLLPFLEALAGKVQRLKGCLEEVNKAVDQELVIAKERMSARAHASIERAVTGRDSHAAALLQLLEDLKARSAPERLPSLMDSMGDACMQLEGVLSSPQFRTCVGDRFPVLPSLRDGQHVMAGLGDRPARQSAPLESSHVRILELPS